MVTDPRSDDTPSLPPFSGKDGACPKCGSRCAESKWLIKPVGNVRDHIPRTDEAKKRAEWFTLYWIGGDWEVARMPVAPLMTLGPADWYPNEWLGRHCLTCGCRWDEAVVEREADDA
jgi:hypothetical protein